MCVLLLYKMYNKCSCSFILRKFTPFCRELGYFKPFTFFCDKLANVKIYAFFCVKFLLPKLRSRKSFDISHVWIRIISRKIRWFAYLTMRHRLQCQDQNHPAHSPSPFQMRINIQSKRCCEVWMKGKRNTQMKRKRNMKKEAPSREESHRSNNKELLLSETKRGVRRFQ